MKKTTSIILALLAALVLLVSCNNSVDYVLDLPKTTPLTLEFLEDGTLSFANKPATLKYSKNGGELTTAPSSIPVASGDVISLYADRTSAGKYYFQIKCTSDCYVYGNVMSLTSEEDFATKTEVFARAFGQLFYDNVHIKNHPSKKIVLPATTLGANCYRSMFYGCTGLTEAPDLPATSLASECYHYMFYNCTNLTKVQKKLPATVLADYCYSYMFCGCSNLTEGPALPATEMKKFCYEAMFFDCVNLEAVPQMSAATVAENCFWYMFHNCVKITEAPDLPATTLAYKCYYGMFYGCKSLTKAPVLPAKTLAERCYDHLFYGCTKLNSVTCLATDRTAPYCTNVWLSGVSSTGTFTRAEGADWPSGTSGIPSGWEIVE